MNKKEHILNNQDALLNAMLNKDEQELRKLIHPDATVFGSAINEFEKGIDRVIHYYTQSIALLPDDRRIEIKWKNFADLGNLALVEQEYTVHFTLEDQEITLLTLRQSALWTFTRGDNNHEDRWLLLHDHTSMPDHLGAYETISSNEMLESNLNLELEADHLKKQLNQSLSALKTAQDQLVQKERLASIGKLTAGIAHEIKNPLNFVNNFSELSVELIQEVREGIKSLQVYRDTALPEGALSDMSEILNDIEGNLRKIHEHGSRADSIVKSMLLHSRGGSGVMEPTDLNALVIEYVNLAFHGMRAGKDPINVDIELSLSETIGTVPLIAEDFSRVILNLCHNAFDAMREKLKTAEEYEPKLTVLTNRNGKSITIKIEDNGPGIPDEIKNKILQPFFTTKKGTDGTGLGLSITNDIITAHGGEIAIGKPADSAGTSFKITLL